MDSTFIIAEAGVNHNGSVDLAKDLISAAVDSGADAVKFQTFRAESLVTTRAEKVSYQQKAVGKGGGQLEMLKRLELSEDEFALLFDFASEKGIEVFSTAFDLDSLKFLHGLGSKRFKVPSGEITNYPLLKAIAEIGEPTIISTGTSNLGEIEAALNVFEEQSVPEDRLTVLHCTTAYPAPLESVNLRAMDTIGAAFPGVQIGFSDHTEGIAISVAAAARGAKVIEKHFTLDRQMEGPDHQASLDPRELKQMVESIRAVNQSLGIGRKRMTNSEQENIVAVRKSIVASRQIKKGEIFDVSNLTTKRPGDGISPMLWNELIGKPAQREYDMDEQID